MYGPEFCALKLADREPFWDLCQAGSMARAGWVVIGCTMNLCTQMSQQHVTHFSTESRKMSELCIHTCMYMYVCIYTRHWGIEVGRSDSNSYLWMWLKHPTWKMPAWSIEDRRQWKYLGRCTRQHLILLRFLSFWSWRDQASLPLGKYVSDAQKTGMLHHGWVIKS